MIATYFGFPRKYGGYVTKIQITQFFVAIAIFAVSGAKAFVFKTCQKQSLEGWAFVYSQYLIFLYLFVVFSQKRKAKFSSKNDCGKNVSENKRKDITLKKEE